jgi:hypothetical protein
LAEAEQTATEVRHLLREADASSAVIQAILVVSTFDSDFENEVLDQDAAARPVHPDYP